MRDLRYIVMVWLVGVFASPILLYFFTRNQSVFFNETEESFLTIMNVDFMDWYLLIVIIGGIFSLIPAFILVLLFKYYVTKEFKTIFKIKLITQISVIVLIWLTIVFSMQILSVKNFEFLYASFPYLITTSIAIWLLNLDTEKKDDIPFIDDEVL